MALRHIFSLVAHPLIILLGSALIIYILVALVFTFKYRAGLCAEQQWDGSDGEVVRGRLCVAAEKEQSKLEKKRAKGEVKAKKKGQMNQKEALR